MNKKKLFIENMLVYGLGGVISKLVPFIMLPVVTRLMPNTTYFGLNDISVTIVSFGSALAIMGMYDAMFRIFFEKEEKKFKQEICSSALGFTLSSSIIVFIILIVFQKNFSFIFFGTEKYAQLICLSAINILIGTTNTIVSAPTRMQNKRKIYLVTNTLSPVISYSVSIPLLLKGYYLIALPLASIASAAIIEIIFLLLNREWFSLRKIKLNHIKNMLKFALPLLPNFLIYWIFNSSDRLMIAHILGNEQVGVYAIGGKIGQVSQLIYTAFAGGWQFFAFKTMKENDQVKTNSNIFEYLGIITFATGMLMAACSNVFFEIIFTGDYLKGAIVAPYLFIAPLLQMLFQVIGNQFLIIKRTMPVMLILGVGAIFNVIANLVLIPKLGIEGAALSTLLGYIVSVIICAIILKRMKLFQTTKRFMICVTITIIYFVLWRIIFQSYFIISVSLAVACILCYIYCYRGDIKLLIRKNN